MYKWSADASAQAAEREQAKQSLIDKWMLRMLRTWLPWLGSLGRS
jgi:hypothetical protein